MNAEVVERVSYFPFGETRLRVDSTLTHANYGFTQKETDKETGMMDFGARFYVGRLPVFSKVDYKALVVSSKTLHSPQELNSYAFCSDNPIKFIDPDGREGVNSKSTIGDRIWLGVKGLMNIGAGVVGTVAGVAATGAGAATCAPTAGLGCAAAVGGTLATSGSLALTGLGLSQVISAALPAKSAEDVEKLSENYEKGAKIINSVKPSGMAGRIAELAAKKSGMSEKKAELVGDVTSMAWEFGSAGKAFSEIVTSEEVEGNPGLEILNAGVSMLSEGAQMLGDNEMERSKENEEQQRQLEECVQAGHCNEEKRECGPGE
ncbi:MAG TPA: RHS repeat-associated core domain-containing protein [Candidatus Acidoferrum sp.]|nr:RHS repeat-associated core domain-containing protein [Candidatus Acidoferrum sp.]